MEQLTTIGVHYAWGLWTGEIITDCSELTFLSETDVEILLDINDNFQEFYTDLIVLHSCFFQIHDY